MRFLSRYPRIRAALVLASIFSVLWSVVPLSLNLLSGRFRGFGAADIALSVAKSISISILTGTIMGLMFAALISRGGRSGSKWGRVSRFFGFGAAGGLAVFVLLLVDAALRDTTQVNWMLGAATFMASGGAVGAIFGRLASSTSGATTGDAIAAEDDLHSLSAASMQSLAVRTHDSVDSAAHS
jgi:hypothetical protein